MSDGNGDGGGSSIYAAAGPSTTSALPSAPSPDYDRFWAQASSSAAPHISSIRRRLPHFPSAPLRIQRVSQLDAELLDEELTTMLLEPLKASLAQIKSTLPDRWEPELLALLKLVLYKYSIVDRGASYGAMLQNLRYRNEWAHKGGLQSTFLSAPLSRTQLLLYPLLTIALPYAYEKLNRNMTAMSFSDLPHGDPRRVLWTMVDKAQKCYEGVALANFLAFLGNGRYRTVTDRLLGMRLTYAQRTLNRNVSFEFLNRQLVWHAFTEFLLFLLPIIRPKRLLRRLMRLPTHPRILAFWLAVLPYWLSKRIGLYKDAAGKPRYRLPVRIPFVTSNKASSDAQSMSSKYANLPADICAICWDRIQEETSSSSSATASGALSVGIPTSDPLDPSSGALAPTRGAGGSSAAAHSAAQARLQSYHQASHAFGVSQDGIPYSNALVHIPYAAKPCGCVYCYYCLAEKLLSEEAGEELQDSLAGGGGGVDGNNVEADQEATTGDVGAWDCLRCTAKVRGMSRVESVDEEEDEEDEDGEEADVKQLSGKANGNGRARDDEAEEDQEEELDLDRL